jgi:hypothetical protein
MQTYEYGGANYAKSDTTLVETRPTTELNWQDAPSWATHILKTGPDWKYKPAMINEQRYAVYRDGVYFFGPELSDNDAVMGRTGWVVASERPTRLGMTSIEYLRSCIDVQAERGEQYDSKGTGERSFAAAAEAYNAVTGRDLKGSDVCLILEMVKNVRQYSDPTRLHADSVLDKVSYAVLWAEELNKELI